MRSYTLIFFLSVIFPIIALSNENNNPEIDFIAEDVKGAVLRENTNTLMKYVSSAGTYFIDNVYTYEQIEKLLKDKDSWLCKHLFSGENSVKNYFKSSKNLKVKIYNRNNSAIMLSYQSSNHDAVEWVECCFINISGRWYFDGIFYCG